MLQRAVFNTRGDGTHNTRRRELSQFARLICSFYLHVTFLCGERNHVFVPRAPLRPTPLEHLGGRNEVYDDGAAAQTAQVVLTVLVFGHNLSLQHLALVLRQTAVNRVWRERHDTTGHKSAPPSRQANIPRVTAAACEAPTREEPTQLFDPSPRTTLSTQ